MSPRSAPSTSVPPRHSSSRSRSSSTSDWSLLSPPREQAPSTSPSPPPTVRIQPGPRTASPTCNPDNDPLLPPPQQLRQQPPPRPPPSPATPTTVTACVPAIKRRPEPSSSAGTQADRKSTRLNSSHAN